LVLRSIAVTAVVFGFLLADRAGAQGLADPPDLRRWEFSLENTRYQIMLPGHATAMRRVDGFSVSLSQRLMRQLHIRPAPRGGDTTHAHTENLGDGAVLRYNIDRDVGAGSGGTEGRLDGVLQIGTRTLAVTCSDQDELSTPRPEWCLPFLRELRIDGGR
jgi:hypothetical protein